MSSSGTSESPTIAPNLQRSHTLVLRSFHSRSQLLRDLVLWHFGVSNHCSGSSKHSHPCSHFFAWQGYTFSSSAHNSNIWDTSTLTKPGVVFQKMLSLTTRDRSFRPLRTTCKSQLHILGDSQFPLSSSLFTNKKPQVETKEYSHPPWMGLCNLCK